MNLNTLKIKPVYVIFAVLAIASVLTVAREITIKRNQPPLEVTHKIRNASAHEEEWQIATAAQPGDVLDNFLLVHLPHDYHQALKDVKILSFSSNNEYREATLKSSAKGISGQSGSSYAKDFFGSKGIYLAQIKPGEFIDFAWQSRINPSVEFENSLAPIMETSVEVLSKNFSKISSKTLVSLFSTIERSKIVNEAKEQYYTPKIVGMNPRIAFEDLGTGVLIAGEDLEGIKNLRIASNGQKLAWRMISGNLIEASIPSGLSAGEYEVEFIDYNGGRLAQSLEFSIKPSKDRAIITKATPNIVKSGSRRIIVLQGIRLETNLNLKLKKSGSNGIVVLDNLQKITSRVLAAEVPENAQSGNYTIFIGDEAQDAKVVVK